MVNGPEREMCGKCEKFIYIHDKILVCTLENKTYHAKCLKICNDVATELQQLPEWFCPLCMENAIPFFNCCTIDQGFVNCNSCCKQISNSKHKIAHCTLCDATSHANCLINLVCSRCYNKINDNIKTNHERDLCTKHFDPFTDFDEDDDNGFYFDDDVDDTVNSTQIIKNILSNCKYHNPHELPLANLHHTTFYFNNIDGFKTNFNEFLANRLNHKHNFDFYCFNETNVKENEPHDFEIENYTSEMLYGIEDKAKGSGLALFFRNTLPFTRLKFLSIRNKYFETLGGKLKCDLGHVYIVTVYRYNQNCSDEFQDEFFKLLETVIDKPCVILGDFNLDTLHYSTSRHVQKLVDNFITYGFSPLISKATNFFKSGSTGIDHIWCNVVSSNIYSGVIKESTSSHKPIFANIPTKADDLENDSQSTATFFAQNISSKNIENFQLDLKILLENFSTVNAQPDITSTDAKFQFSSFYTKLKEIYNKHFVEEVNCDNKRNFINKPWITLGIAKSCKIKNELHNVWIDSRNKENEAEAEFEFKVYRARLRDLIREVKNKYFTNRFKKCSGDIKRSWKVLNEIRNKKKKLSFPKYIDFNGSLITSRRVILAEFNNYFVNIANNLNKGKKDSDCQDFHQFMKNRVDDSIFLNDITPNEIEDIIKNLNPNKSSDLSPRILKLVRYSISPVLTALFNNCMHASVFPDELKVARVIPLFKAGDKNDITNYRPISLLPVLSKIFEKLIHCRMTAFLDKHHVLYKKQFGFRKQHSTIHALNTAVTQIVKSLNNDDVVIGVFLDFSKAFDTVVHRILLRKLEHYGIRGKALDLLTNYLSNRKQFVCVDGIKSDLLDITNGVPQGSVLGPLLFLLYINDLVYSQCKCTSRTCMSNCTETASFILFADDTNLFVNGNDIISVASKTNLIISNIKRYLEANYLHINIKKSNFIHFTSPRSKKEKFGTNLIMFDSQPLIKVTETKFLGVIIDEKLDWKSHIKYIGKKVSSTTRSLWEMRRIITKSLRNSVYNALVNSHLSYAISVWGSGANVSKLKPLFTIQKRCLRNLFKIRKVSEFIKGHTKSTFNNHKILSVYNLYFYFTVSCIARLRQLRSPEYLYSLLNIDNDKHRIIIPLLKTEHYQQNFLYQGPKLWNQILPYIKDRNFNIPSTMSLFKSRTKDFLLKLQSYGDENNWTPANSCSDTYLTMIKCDPYASTSQIAPKQNPINSKKKSILPFIDHDQPCKFCSIINVPPYFQGPPILETVEHVLTECLMYHSLRTQLSEKLKTLIVRTEYSKITNSTAALAYEFEAFVKNCEKLKYNKK